MSAKIQILSNTNYPLEDVLRSELLDCSNVRIAVAFLKKSGLDRISDSLNFALTAKGATVEIIVGLDFRTTDAPALSALKKLENSNSNFKFYCFGDKKRNYNELVFHPKIYLFDKSSTKGSRFTSIIGSSNLTGGGLTTNFEVNSVFREETPVYYGQLAAIYNEIKYTDSVFCPSPEYISKYANVQTQISNADNSVVVDTQAEIEELRQTEQSLPGAAPSLKRIIIEFLQDKERQGEREILLRDIYSNVTQAIIDKQIPMKMDTLNNSIRGELNKHEANSRHEDCAGLFKRTEKATYSLTDKGRKYSGR